MDVLVTGYSAKCICVCGQAASLASAGAGGDSVTYSSIFSTLFAGGCVSMPLPVGFPRQLI